MESIEEIINLFNSSSKEKELEYRLGISRNEFINMITWLQTQTHSIYKLINFIKNEDKGSIVRCVDLTTEKKEKCYKKNILKQYLSNNPINHKIVLSEEIPHKCINISETDIIRYKARISCNYSKIWRIDLTMAYTARISETINLKEAVKRLFNPIKSINDFNDEIMNNFTTWELEFECLAKKVEMKDLEILGEICKIFNPSISIDINYSKSLHAVAKLLNKPYAKTIKQLTQNPLSFTRNEYMQNIYPNIENYFICKKIDGIHTMILVKDKKCQIFAEHLIEYPVDETAEFILDGEFKDECLYVFDCLYDKEDNHKKSFETKLDNIKEYTNIVKKYHKCTEMQMFYSVKYNTYENILTEIKKETQKKKLEIDGLIYTPKKEISSQMTIWKWKPIEQLSIDFLVRKAPKDILGTQHFAELKNHTLYCLFVTIDYSLMNRLGLHFMPSYKSLFANMIGKKTFPIQFSTSDNPYLYTFQLDKKSEFEGKIDGKIAEMTYNSDSSEWKILRIREDRDIDLKAGNYFGNYYRIAELTWQNIIMPITMEYLYKPHKESYFKVDKDNSYKGLTSFISFCKSQIFSNYADADTLLDLGGGRGQDIKRYQDNRIKKVVVIDNDKEALSELVQRKYKIKVGSSNINVMHADLTIDHNVLLDKLKTFGVFEERVGGVVSNYSFHYLCDSTENIANVIKLVSQALKTGAMFSILGFSGELVHKILENTKEYVLTENDITKYKIVKCYTSSLANYGQKIKVLLPFSGGELYEEYLVNDDYIQKIAQKNKLQPVSNEGVLQYLDKFKHSREDLFKLLSENDLKYLELSRILTFKKKGPIAKTGGSIGRLVVQNPTKLYGIHIPEHLIKKDEKIENEKIEEEEL
jgi:hypothetical protein